MKNISILGSTGSIGTQTLQVIAENPDKINVVGLTTNNNIELLEKQMNVFMPQIVAVYNSSKASELRKKTNHKNVEILEGLEGLIEVAKFSNNDMIVTAVPGMIGLQPTINAIKNGINIALANKETLVTGGSLVMAECQKYDVDIYPVDSEHSAIFQCLYGNDIDKVNKIILTASGGPFRNKTKEELKNVNLEQALNHPNWKMGKKVTIDSSTLMNKGFEVIEAKWLFNMDISKIEVLVHPQSIIHSMVEYVDHSIIAQLGTPDMRVPIQNAIFYPERIANNFEPLNFMSIGSLEFKLPDKELFPCLQLAFDAIGEGGSMPAVLNAANEIAVESFLNNEISYLDISEINSKIMNRHSTNHHNTLEDILEIDHLVRIQTKELISEIN
jgi:1-deoxy-D-xylulose-5-phosphate reductoisomerase